MSEGNFDKLERVVNLLNDLHSKGVEVTTYVTTGALCVTIKALGVYSWFDAESVNDAIAILSAYNQAAEIFKGGV